MTTRDEARAALERRWARLRGEQEHLFAEQVRLDRERADLAALEAFVEAPSAPEPEPVGYRFFDDFGAYAVGSKIGSNNFDMFTKQGGPWSQYLGAGAGYRAEHNVFEVTDDVPAGGGANVFHVRTDQRDHDAVYRLTRQRQEDGEDIRPTSGVKCSLIKGHSSLGGFKLWDDDIVSCVQRLYLPSEGNAWLATAEGRKGGAPRWCDIGQRWWNSVAQMRGSCTGPSNTLSFNRKGIFWPGKGHTPADSRDNPGVHLPLDRWFELELRYRIGVIPLRDKEDYPFDPDADAWLQIAVGGEVAIARTCTTRGHDAERDKAPIDTLEVGATISGVTCEWFIDWVRFETVDGPIV